MLVIAPAVRGISFCVPKATPEIETICWILFQGPDPVLAKPAKTLNKSRY